jgi:hypothetical protein
MPETHRRNFMNNLPDIPKEGVIVGGGIGGAALAGAAIGSIVPGPGTVIGAGIGGIVGGIGALIAIAVNENRR